MNVARRPYLVGRRGVLGRVRPDEDGTPPSLLDLLEDVCHGDLVDAEPHGAVVEGPGVAALDDALLDSRKVVLNDRRDTGKQEHVANLGEGYAHRSQRHTRAPTCTQAGNTGDPAPCSQWLQHDTGVIAAPAVACHVELTGRGPVATPEGYAPSAGSPIRCRWAPGLRHRYSINSKRTSK